MFYGLSYSCVLDQIFFCDPVILESNCYCTRAYWLINESNTTGGLRKNWTGHSLHLWIQDSFVPWLHGSVYSTYTIVTKSHFPNYSFTYNLAGLLLLLQTELGMFVCLACPVGAVSVTRLTRPIIIYKFKTMSKMWHKLNYIYFFLSGWLLQY